MRAALCLLLATASAASADELPTIESTHPAAVRIATDDPYGVRETVHAVTLALHGGDDPSWLRIATGGRAGQGRKLLVDLPAGARVIGFGVSDLDHTLVWGHAVEAIDAHHDRSLDARAPALVEYAGRSADEDHVAIQLDQPGTVELAIVFPAIEKLAVEAPARTDLVVTGVPFAKGIADLRGIARPSEPATVYLDDTTSFISSVESNRLVIIDSWGHETWTESPGNRGTLRREIKLHEPVLMHCYMQEAQRDPSLRDRQVSLHLAIDQDGTVDKVSLENVPDAVAPCFEAEITQWRFLPMGSYVQANYPLNLKVNEP